MGTRLRWVFVCAAVTACGNSIGNGGGGSGSFGVAGSAWEVNFSSMMRGNLTSSDHTATFLLTSAAQDRQISSYDPMTGTYGPVDCRRVVDQAELGLTYANDGSRFIVTVASLRQYAGSACEMAGYTVSTTPTRRPSDGYTAVRQSSTSSIFGELGGRWQLLDYRGRLVCNITVSGSSFSGDCDGYTFQGTIGGSNLVGTDNRGASFAGTQR